MTATIVGPCRCQPDREHLVDVRARDIDALRQWLARPNGSLSLGRVSFNAVEGGGVLVRTQPYRTESQPC